MQWIADAFEFQAACWRRFLAVLRMLLPARFTLIVLALLGLLLFKTTQAQDVVYAAVFEGRQEGWFLAMLFLLALESWYWTRFVYDFFDGEDVGRGAGQGARTAFDLITTRHHLRLWLPRVIGTLPFLIVLASAWKSDQWKTSDLIKLLPTALLLCLFLTFTILRRAYLLPLLPPALRDDPSERRDFPQRAKLSGVLLASTGIAGTLAAFVIGRASEGTAPWAFSWMPALALAFLLLVAGLLLLAMLPVPRGSRYWLLSLFLLAFGGHALAAAGPAQFYAMGSGAILFSAAASWIGMINLFFIFSGDVLGFPVATPWFAIVAALFLLSPVNSLSNHAVRLLADAAPARVSVSEAFAQWQAQAPSYVENGVRHVPLVLAASQGGASRAGYFSSLVLGRLEDDAPGFHKSVFALSGVSGGSLGIGLYAAQLRAAEAGPATCRAEKDKVLQGFSTCASVFMGDDFLSPDFSRLFYTDILQDFLPGWIFKDRADALETAWEDAWELHFPKTPGLAAPLGDLATLHRPQSPWLPLLIFNGASVYSGRRIITSDFSPFAGAGGQQSLFLDAEDFLGMTGHDVRLSTAMHNTARFPFISPAGLILVDKGSSHPGTGTTLQAVDRIADGGYFENLGAGSLIDLINALAPVLAAQAKSASGEPVSYDIIVLALENDQPEAPGAGSCAFPCPMQHAAELFAPLLGLWETRAGHQGEVLAQLRRMEGEHLRLVEIQSLWRGVDPAYEPAVNWVLSRRSQEQITHGFGLWIAQKGRCGGASHDDAPDALGWCPLEALLRRGLSIVGK